MHKQYVLLVGLLITTLQATSQMYILNEDFSGASGITPPAGWVNVKITGTDDDKWHFDNPGLRILNYPVTEPFAIFDSENISANGREEEIALETSLFDASTSNYILLNFVHVFDPASGGAAVIEAFDGDIWHEVATYSSATANPESEIVDLSSITGGITNAKVRFIWSGNGSGFWAIDNIRIYASLPYDGSVVAVDSPNSPVVPGLQNVAITLGNFGYNTITSTQVNWSVNGIPQPQHNWLGSIGFGQTESNIVIGMYDFQESVVVKVWQSNPNGMPDLNPYNDTISKYLVPALCGTYTIGGNDPDFESFSQVARELNAAGITCPVTFLVRDGMYIEQFELGEIQGVSAENTITFRSESGDSSKAVIKIIPESGQGESMIYLTGSQYINFQNLGFRTGSSKSIANNAVLLSGARHVGFTGCYFMVQSLFDYGLAIKAGSQDISIENTRIESLNTGAGAINISNPETSGIRIIGNNIKGATGKGYYTIQATDFAGNIELSGNQLDQCYVAINLLESDSVSIRDNMITNSNNGVSIGENCICTEVSGNRFINMKHHPDMPEGTSSIAIGNATNTIIFNNYIHTTGSGSVIGISLNETAACQVFYNSINVTNNELKGNCYGIKLIESEEIVAENNVFTIVNKGFPVYIDEFHPQLYFDYNDYYNLDQTIGYFNGIVYTDFAGWTGALGMDINSLSVPPFYTSATDLSINQVLLNDAGLAVAGIDHDINGILRDPVNPDIGATEHELCADDAGVNAVTWPQNPVTEGLQNVKVILQNQGTNTLTDALINWEVNGQSQEPFPWSGNLAQGINTEIQIGDYDFQQGILYRIKAWTAEPNNLSDCNHSNDTISSRELAVSLCGTFTIGGTNPDFSSFDEAVNLLNLAGVECPVTFLVRNGTYYELLNLTHIPGTSSGKPVTFRSVSGDSTQAVMKIKPAALKYESMVTFDGVSYIKFEGIGFITGSEFGSYNNAALLESSHHIEFESCYFESVKEFDIGIKIQEGSYEIEVIRNRFECVSSRASAVDISGTYTQKINIEGSRIRGALFNEFPTLRIGNYAHNLFLTDNYIERCTRPVYLVNTDSVIIQGNYITNTNEGIIIDDFCSRIKISENRLINITGHESAQNGTSAIQVDHATEIEIFNNYIHTTGDGQSTGINLQYALQCIVHFNSVNITNYDNQSKSKGIYLKECNFINARNNVFNVSVTGTPVYITALASQIDFDHNDYHSFDQTIGYYHGNRYTDLAIWRDSLDMDLNSLSVIPFFTSPTNLAINQTLLNGAGIPAPGINTDIEGIVRDPAHPDIGAKEYNLCPVDAGINAVLSPENPLSGGIEAVKVVLQNQGSVSLTSAKINWAVNDELQSPFTWTGNLAVKASVEVIAGQYNFLSGKSFIIKVWTSEPNNTTDCNHSNDTIKSRELAGSLCGSYTIGGTNADFETFNQVADVLNTSGISCPVTFLVRDGAYPSKFILGEIAGSSEENIISFLSESGNNKMAVIQLDPEALGSEPMIFLKGTKYVNFTGLGFFTGSDQGIANQALRLDGAKNINFTGCYIQAKKQSDYGLVIQAASQDISIKQCQFKCIDYRASAININGDQTSKILVDDNIIQGPSTWGSTLVSLQNRISHINFTKNVIDSCVRSIYIYQADSLTITQNTLRNTYEGIYLNGLCSAINISQNRLINIQSTQNSPEGTYGIFVQNSNEIEIVDNFIHTTGNGAVIGLGLVNATSCRIHYNTVNTTNNDAQAKSKGIYLKTSSDLVARNNLFNIKVTGLPIQIDAGVTGLSLDYCNYYHPAGLIGKVNNVVYTNLFEWGQTNNSDANSRAVNPYFKADTIPLPYQRILNGSGIPVAGVIYDIDGKLRHNQAPDIGCMEFFVDFGVLELISPTLECYHPNVDSVKVYIRQFGDVPFENLKVAYQMDNGTVHTDTIPGPVIYDFIHTFGSTETISTYGNYLFKIWLIGTLDDNINNDTLKVWRYSKPAPELSYVYDNECTGWEVYFTGTATVAAPYYIAGYEWFFGDGDTAYVQNPVHTFTEAGTYQVVFRAYSDAGCYSETSEAFVIDVDFQALNLDYSLQDEICIGDGSGRLELVGSGGNPPYMYYVNGTPVDGSIVTNLQPGVYEILVEDSKQCATRDTVESFVLVNMSPSIEAEPDSGFVPLTVNFDFTANGAAGWTWYFPENITDTSISATYTFIEYGLYTVVLEVNSGPPYFCSDTATITIFADIIITIEANNVFTPNDDGANDYFEIRSVGIEEMDVFVFNQWGMKIKEFDGLSEKWNGETNDGSEAPDGTYFWSLTARGVNQKTYERQGSVLLLRHGAEAFPNPFSGKVNLKVHEILQAPVWISVFSVFGQLAYTDITNATNNITLDLSALEDGIYILKIDDGSKQAYVRIIKN